MTNTLNSLLVNYAACIGGSVLVASTCIISLCYAAANLEVDTLLVYPVLYLVLFIYYFSSLNNTAIKQTKVKMPDFITIMQFNLSIGLIVLFSLLYSEDNFVADYKLSDNFSNLPVFLSGSPLEVVFIVIGLSHLLCCVILILFSSKITVTANLSHLVRLSIFSNLLLFAIGVCDTNYYASVDQSAEGALNEGNLTYSYSNRYQNTYVVSLSMAVFWLTTSFYWLKTITLHKNE